MRVFTLLFFMVCCNCVQSQEKKLHEITVFDSYEDYTNEKGVHFDKLLTWKKSSHIVLVVESESGKDKVKCDEIWGFEMGDALFRITERGKFARVMVQGGIVYYENGAVHANIMRRGVGWASTPPGESVFFLSGDMNSELVPVPNAEINYIGGTPKYDAFKERHPLFEELYRCLDSKVESHLFVSSVKSCVKEYLN